jgi:hypothetical protein
MGLTTMDSRGPGLCSLIFEYSRMPPTRSIILAPGCHVPGRGSRRMKNSYPSSIWLADEVEVWEPSILPLPNNGIIMWFGFALWKLLGICRTSRAVSLIVWGVQSGFYAYATSDHFCSRNKGWHTIVRVDCFAGRTMGWDEELTENIDKLEVELSVY